MRVCILIHMWFHQSSACSEFLICWKFEKQITTMVPPDGIPKARWHKLMYTHREFNKNIPQREVICRWISLMDEPIYYGFVDGWESKIGPTLYWQSWIPQVSIFLGHLGTCSQCGRTRPPCMKFIHICIHFPSTFIFNKRTIPTLHLEICMLGSRGIEHEPKLILCKYNMLNQGFFTHKNKCSVHEKLRTLENHTHIILRLMNFQSKWSTSSTVTLGPPKNIARSARDKPWLKSNRGWGNTKPKKLKALHVESLSNILVLRFEFIIISYKSRITYATRREWKAKSVHLMLFYCYKR